MSFEWRSSMIKNALKLIELETNTSVSFARTSLVHSELNFSHLHCSGLQGNGHAGLKNILQFINRIAFQQNSFDTLPSNFKECCCFWMKCQVSFSNLLWPRNSKTWQCVHFKISYLLCWCHITFCSCLALAASSAFRLSSNQRSWYLCPRRL